MIRWDYITLAIIAFFVLAYLLERKHYARYNTSLNYAVVDFSLPSTQKRFVIYNQNGRELFRTYVAHGIGSGKGIMATRFSNTPGSL